MSKFRNRKVVKNREKPGLFLILFLRMNMLDKVILLELAIIAMFGRFLQGRRLVIKFSFGCRAKVLNVNTTEMSQNFYQNRSICNSYIKGRLQKSQHKSKV